MIASSSDHYNSFCAKYSQLSSVPSSPERRFKSISPCRRLFEDVSTNQNQVTSNSFVVSNGPTISSPFHLTTIETTNNNQNNNAYYNNNENQFEIVTKDVGIINSSSHLVTTTNSNIEDILISTYQRRRNINSFKTSTTSTTLNINNNSSPFMDDLGFLSTTSSSSLEGEGEIEMNENENENNNDNENDSPFSKIKSFSTSNSIHWNRRIIPSNRRCMSVTSDIRKEFVPVVSENGSIHHLPCFDSPHDAIKRISPDTLVDLLEGKYGGVYERILIVDCRYPYEYDGGHIPTAINVNNPEVIEKLLFANVSSTGGKTVIVFHCEFSSERAPRMALHVRNLDRQLNKSSYPALIYPEMYILDGGYKNYWQRHDDKCEPPKAYIPMRNPEHREQLRHHQKIKYAFKSGCHLSQHSAIKKKLPPKSRKSQERSKSLNIANARKFFNDLIQSTEKNAFKNSNSCDSDQDLSFNADNQHMFPSFTIPTVNSFSSIFASEIDIPDEMDMD